MTPTRLCSPGSGTLSPKISEACGEDAKACDAIGEGPTWIALYCTSARTIASVYAEPHSSGNVDHGNLNLPLEEFFDAPAVNHLRGHRFKVRQLGFDFFISTIPWVSRGTLAEIRLRSDEWTEGLRLTSVELIVAVVWNFRDMIGW